MATDKRYLVFVSSTYEDLKDERNKVMEALLKLDCIPAGMELFPSSNFDPLTLIQQVIDQCDYYIVIVAGKYGKPDAVTGLSYTEREYDYAIEKEKPVLTFMHRNPGSLSAERTEDSDDGRRLLSAFREKIKAKKLVKFWDTVGELGGEVAISLLHLIKTHPTTGWVNGRDATTQEQELKLHRRIDELESQLEAARSSPPPGTEDLAQGKDPIQIDFEYENSAGRESTGTRPSDWNEVFTLLGPHMLDQCSELRLHSVLRDFISTGKSWTRVGVRDACFQRIKTQLFALGLVDLSVRPRARDDSATYLTLTQYGKSYLLRHSAIRRPASP